MNINIETYLLLWCILIGDSKLVRSMGGLEILYQRILDMNCKYVVYSYEVLDQAFLWLSGMLRVLIKLQTNNAISAKIIHEWSLLLWRHNKRKCKCIVKCLWIKNALAWNLRIRIIMISPWKCNPSSKKVFFLFFFCVGSGWVGVLVGGL